MYPALKSVLRMVGFPLLWVMVQQRYYMPHHFLQRFRALRLVFPVVLMMVIPHLLIFGKNITPLIMIIHILIMLIMACVNTG
ncbi:hypothetical protein AOY87_12205 [Escherichia coli]|nr:hypothetical protein AOY87_12205 [Escherichia coli]